MSKDTLKIYLFGFVVAALVGLITASIVNYHRSSNVNLGAAVTAPANVMQDNDPATPISNLVSINHSITKLLDVAGVATFTDVVKAQDSASSTLYIGGQGSNITYSGCLVMGNATYGSPVYVTVASSTISATTTKPAICQ